MFETLANWNAQALVTYAVAAMALFFGIDVWQRLAPALPAPGDRAGGARRVTALVLGAWLLLALTLTLVPRVRDAVGAIPLFQPLSAVLGVLGVTALMLLPAMRRAFDAVPLADVMALFYWRAIFGMALLAYYTGAVLPATFALPAAFGDAFVTCLMVMLLTLAHRHGGVPRWPLLAWNTLGLIDLVNVMFLLATVLRPWAAERGLVLGNYALSGFAVPIFIGIHLNLYARLYREHSARSADGRIPNGAIRDSYR